MAEEEAKPAEEKKGKGLIFIIIGVVVAVLILVGVVVFLFMGGEEEGHGGGGNAPSPQVANLTPEQQALLQNEAYKNPAAIMPLEKEFIVNLKSQDPESLRGAGFAKFKITFILADKNTLKEIDAKLDIVRTVITDVASGFMGTELQSSQGRRKLAGAIVASINSILTDGKIAAVVFPDFMIQP